MKVSKLSPARKRRRFANQMIAALRRSGEADPIRYDAQANKLLIGKDPNLAFELFLGNAYGNYRDASPGNREEVIRQYARGALAIKQGTPLADRFDEARENLLPRVTDRTRYTFSTAPRGHPRHQDGSWHRPLADHLAVGLAYDHPSSITDVSEGDLARWAVTGEEAFTVACENLRRRSTQPFESPAPGAFVSPWQDNSGASRLVLTDLIRDLEVKGNYVALVPDRDTLIVTGSEDPAGLQVMLQLAEEAFCRPYRVSGFALRLREGQWEPFEPDTCYPGLEGFRSLRLQSLESANEQQKQALDALHEQKGEDLCVAFYLLLSKDRRTPLTSCAVWPDGITTLLPRAEKVAFAQGGQVAAFADWERVRDVVGDLMTPLDLYPPRYRVNLFPTGAQLKALGFAHGFEELGMPSQRVGLDSP